MADAITALWHGNNYQSRFFWIYALDLLRPETCVNKVTFEASGPKSFDDVVVHYDPPVVRGTASRIEAEYFQVKWHTDASGRFGYEDLVEPKFIGARSVSVLERLRDAKADVADSARFVLVTTDRITDDDPLSRLFSSNDRSLLVERLFDDTTDASRMGKVRKCWREHLGLSNNEALRDIVSGLTIFDGHAAQQQLREEINLRADIVGLKSYPASDSDFRYDELARQLKIRQLSELSAESLITMAKEEGIWVGKDTTTDEPLTVAIRSFAGLSTQTVPCAEENTLWLTDSFRQRYLVDNRDWQSDIQPQVIQFLNERTAQAKELQLVLDAHASIAYLAGSVLNLKSGKHIKLVQKGRVGTMDWIADDGTVGDPLEYQVEHLSEGESIALAVSITQPVTHDVRRYIDQNLDDVGQYVTFTPPGGPGQRSVAGGEHAAKLAEQIAYRTKELRASRPGTMVHLFAACPNSVLFYLGQNHPAIGPVIVYEFDFDQQGDRSYQPSFVIS